MSVSCAACEQAWPRNCPRCEYLISITRTWRRVAKAEHQAHCQRRGDHSGHVEELYNQEARNG